jgi:hypothetical protein
MHDRGWGPAQQRVLLVCIGVVLASVAWFLAYDVGGREPPCHLGRSELLREHPDAVEFRNTGGGGSPTHSCEAVAADGTVLGRVTYPGTVGWIVVGVMLFAPLVGGELWRRLG